MMPMPLRNINNQWGAIAKTFHWLMAIGLLGNGIWGLCMVWMSPSMAKIRVFALHKSLGLTLLGLMLLRLAWRLGNQPPPPLPAPPWKHRAARAVHALLYLLMAALPLSGWLFNSASGYPLQWFKQFNLPALAARNPTLADLALNMHLYLFWLLLILLALHIAGAMKPNGPDPDAQLRRMLPFARRLLAPPPVKAPK